MRKINRPPTHPGAILKNMYLEPLSLSVSELARHLDVSRIIASKIVNERAPVTADMALRLAKVFNITPNLWLGLQKEYDLWHAERDTDAWKNAVSFSMPLSA